MLKVLGAILFLLVLVVGGFLYWQNLGKESDGPIACTLEAKICPDGSAVGRTGPNCEFAECPKMPDVLDPLEQYIEGKSDLIKLTTPKPYEKVASPLNIAGEARGQWFFEASFPVSLVNWDGLIIAEGVATADGEWMTEDFVPFTSTLEFETDFATDTPEFMKKGALILKKDNPSGLPQHDDSLEIPVVYE